MKRIELSENLVSFTLDDINDLSNETLQQRYERLKSVFGVAETPQPATEEVLAEQTAKAE